METGEPALFVQFSYPRIAFRMMKTALVKRRASTPLTALRIYRSSAIFLVMLGK